MWLSAWVWGAACVWASAWSARWGTQDSNRRHPYHGRASAAPSLLTLKLTDTVCPMKGDTSKRNWVQPVVRLDSPGHEHRPA